MTNYQKTAYLIIGVFWACAVCALVAWGVFALLPAFALCLFPTLILRPWDKVWTQETPQAPSPTASAELLHTLIDEGYILEANRVFFHPRGLALCVAYSDDDGKNPVALGVLDYRYDPEGTIFGDWTPAMREKLAKQEEIRNSKLPTRFKALGYWIEPRPRPLLLPAESTAKTCMCANCGEQIVGKPEFTIHRDGFGEGPQVPLCEECGGEEGPSCEEIWHTIAKDPPR